MPVKHNPRQLKKKEKKNPLPRLRVCELKNIRTVDDVYDRLLETICLPKYFGRNLDALYDSLSVDVPGPFKIIWLDHAASAESLGELYYEGLMDIFQAVEQERRDAQIILDAKDLPQGVEEAGAPDNQPPCDE